MNELRITAHPGENEIKEVHAQLKKFNLAHREPSRDVPIGVFITDESGRKVAGLVGETFGNWLIIDCLWSSEALRGKRTGSALILAAEKEALKRGAKYALVDTCDYQAPGFYVKMGYTEVFRLTEYTRTGFHAYYTKTLMPCDEEPPMEIQVTADVTQNDIDDIHTPLHAFNVAHREPDEHVPLCVFLEDEGGLIADTFGNWLLIHYLWISEELRGQGMGSRMIRAAEAEAAARGAKYAFVDTFSFQAPGFYVKMGYNEVFTQREYPYTGFRTYYTKTL